VERATVQIYEKRGREWADRRAGLAPRLDDARTFARRVPAGAMRVDLGCGAGRYTNELGRPAVALDAAATMLGLLREAAPGALAVRGDLERLPFRRQGLAGAWANMSYLHVPRARLPMALARLHWALRVGGLFDLQVLHGDHEGSDLPDDDIGGRFFAAWRDHELRAVLTGAGFEVEPVEVEDYVVRAKAVRLLSLPDTVGPGMRLLLCGLNPSVYAAEAGVGFARRSNRFWKAAIEAGVVSRERDSEHALREHGVGMTDLVKRATVASAELSADEYRAGVERVRWLVEWLQPGAVCFVGLEGWRTVIDKKAQAGVQPEPFGGRPAYVMPSTSGLNAHSRPAALVEHLRAAAAVADGS
jgi:double-stranded uracil-DNA glycosylase